MVNTLLELVAFALLTAGIYINWGVGWALVGAGLVLGLYVEVRDYLAARLTTTTNAERIRRAA